MRINLELEIRYLIQGSALGMRRARAGQTFPLREGIFLVTTRYVGGGGGCSKMAAKPVGLHFWRWASLW